MKINIESKDYKKVNKILNTLDENIGVAQIYSEMLDNYPNLITEKDLISTMQIEGCGESEAFLHLIFKRENIDYSDRDMNNLIVDSKMENIKKLNTQTYVNNPYYKNIKVKEASLGKYKLSYNYFEPYEAFVCEDTKVKKEDNYREVTTLGYFPERYKYLCLLENKSVWMTITPYEINTMKKSISSVKGKVVVCGLGLGYYPYMISLNKDVEKVFIIEYSGEIIKLFNDNIRCLFPKEVSDKIQILRGDAYKYLDDKNFMSKMNYVFFDLYHTASDALPMYIKAKKFEKKNPNTKFEYWIEDSILALERRIILDVFFMEQEGNMQEIIKKPKNKLEEIELKVYEYLKDYAINTYEDLYNLLCDAKLKEIASNLN